MGLAPLKFAVCSGRYSSDADRSEIGIDVNLDEVRCKCTGVRASAR
jgi:hypothetical protein